MAAWEIKTLWTGKEIGEYRAYTAAEVTTRVGNQRCSCEDLSIRLITDFAETRGLPVSFSNNTYPRRVHLSGGPGTGAGSYSESNVMPFRNGLTPEDFNSKAEFYSTALSSTAANDLYQNDTVKFIPGAVKGKAESLDLAKEGDLILLYPVVEHVQVVTSVGAGIVNIMQGNHRKDIDKATRWQKFRGTNQNDPEDPRYVGEIVAGSQYIRDAKNNWFYKGQDAKFNENHGRVMIWDFDAWNALIVKHETTADETLNEIAQDQWGDETEWKRIYDTNKTKIGNDPTRIRAGMKLYLWK